MLPQKYLCYSYNDSHSPPTSLVYIHMWSQVPTNPFNLTKLSLPPHSKTPSSLQKCLQRPFRVHGCEHKTRLSQSNHTVVQLKQSNRTARLSLRMGNTNTLKPFNRKFTSNCGNKAANGFMASTRQTQCCLGMAETLPRNLIIKKPVLKVGNFLKINETDASVACVTD